MHPVELLDIVDVQGNPLNLVKPRYLVHRDGDWHKTVHVWIKNHTGELLLQKRSSEKESFPNLWDISSAGHIQAGQTSVSAAIQEVREELSIVLEKKELDYLFTIRACFKKIGGDFLDNEISDVYIVTKNVLPQDLHLQKEEISEVQWIAVDDLKKALLSEPQKFVPHEEEYKKLFSSIATRPHTLG
jgi:isopentenyl-diphosphate Delta-isomerase